jgi:hypothetical protein
VRRRLTLVVAVVVTSALAWILMSGPGWGRAEQTDPAKDQALRATSEPGRNSTSVSTVLGDSDLLSGRVISAEDGAPVEGALVFWRSTIDAAVPFLRVRRSEKLGAFSISIPHDGTGGQVLIVRAMGFQMWSGALDSQSAKVIRLERGERISGLVRDDRGNPVAGVRVVAHQPGSRLLWPVTERGVSGESDVHAGLAISDGLGAFAIDGLREGTSYELVPVKAYWTAGVVQDGGQRVAAPSRGVIFRMHPVANISLLPVDRESGSRLVLTNTRCRPPKGVGSANLIQTRLNSAAEFQSAYGRGMESGAEFSMARDGAPDGVSIRFEIGALGCKSLSVEVPLEFGARTQLRVPMEKVEGAWQRVSVRAQFQSGRKFDGRLGVLLRTAVRGTVSGNQASGFAPLEFEDGLATTTLLMREGEYSVRAEGAGVSEFFWLPAAAPSTVRVSAASRVIKIIVRGTPVDFNVENSRGASVRSFDVAVYPESAQFPRAPMQTWDAGFEFGANEPEFRIWVPRGRHVLRVNKVGAGRSDVVIESDGDGRPIRLKVKLKPGTDFDLKQRQRSLAPR